MCPEHVRLRAKSADDTVEDPCPQARRNQPQLVFPEIDDISTAQILFEEIQSQKMYQCFKSTRCEIRAFDSPESQANNDNES